MIGINQFPFLAMKNKAAVQQQKEVACYYCQKIFDTQEIKEWTDNDQTAICPFCEADTIVPNAPEYKLNESALKQAHQFWFKK